MVARERHEVVLHQGPRGLAMGGGADEAQGVGREGAGAQVDLPAPDRVPARPFVRRDRRQERGVSRVTGDPKGEHRQVAHPLVGVGEVGEEEVAERGDPGGAGDGRVRGADLGQGQEGGGAHVHVPGGPEQLHEGRHHLGVGHRGRRADRVPRAGGPVQGGGGDRQGTWAAEPRQVGRLVEVPPAAPGLEARLQASGPVPRAAVGGGPGLGPQSAARR